ncbi:DUF4214 domain-containing protein [Pseudoduganella umbonata]|nr:DUF4214 domain-containing protein [Pseudoduganella umbonata]MBB3224720.1 putative repeat protein (TIGR02059 family) [Pseudoduganella umbonata]
MSTVTTLFEAVLDGTHQYNRPRLPCDFPGQDNDIGYSKIWYEADILAVDQTNQTALFSYTTQILTPTVSGAYTLTVDSAVDLWTDAGVGDLRHDTQIWLYDTTFDPQNPLVNIIAANEDIDFKDDNGDPVNWLSQLPNMALVAGHTYVLVVTTYSADATGAANFSAIGPGELILGELPPDATAPVVSAVGAPAADTYGAGEHLDFTVTFDETVMVDTNGGVPALGLVIGGQAVRAEYAGGSGTATLTFRYTLVNGLQDTDGIAVTALALHGGTIRDLSDNDADPTLHAVDSTSGVLVDSVAPAVVAVAVPVAGTYTAGGQLQFTVTLDEAVTVNTGGGTPRIALVIGSQTVYANYVSGSGTTALVFRHTLTGGKSDSDGITIGALSANGGTLKDAAGNDAALALQGVASTAGVLVDSTEPSVSGNIGIPAPGTYRAGETLSFTVTFDENLTVTGTDSSLSMIIGGTVRLGSFVSATANSITYTYTVQAGDNDANGIAISALSAGTGTIRDAVGNDASLTLFRHVPSTASILVDTQAPAVTGVTVPSNGTHTAGTHLNFTVAFDEAVTVTGTDGTLALTIGGTARSATFLSSSGNTVTYRYTVQAGDNDADGISVGALALGTSTIRDAAGNNAALSLVGKAPSTTGIMVDAQAPAVAGVTVPSNGTHAAGTHLDFTVAFDEAVTVTGTDGTLALTIGGTARSATFLSSSGNTVTYRYTVQAGDNDADGIAVGALALGTSTIRDAADNDAALSLAGNVPSTAGITVDTQAPAVAGVTVPSNGTHAAGTHLDFTVAFDEAVTVTGTDNTLSLTIGATARSATFLSSSGNTVTYRYTVQAGDNDADGIAVGALALGTSTIRDAAGNDAALSLAGTVPSTAGITVDTQAPAVAGVTVPSNGTHAAGTHLDFTVAFDEAVTVTGTDNTLSLTIGGTARSATFLSSSGNTVTYRYTVQAGDNDADGIDVGALALGTSTIRDAAGNDATLSLAGTVPSTAGITVDTQAPAVASVTVPSNGTHAAGTHLDFTVAFDEAVTVTGTDNTLALTIGGTARSATFLSSSGNTVTYRYTVQAGDNDADGIAVGALAVGTSTIRDAAGNDATLTLTGQVPATGNIRIDADAPVVASAIGVPAAATYAAGDTLVFTVTFDSNVVVQGGGSVLGLVIGGSAREATLVSAPGTATLTYAYTVQPGDSDADGIAVTGIALNGSTIRDTAGNDATLALAGHVPPLVGVLVDTQAPSVAGVIAPAADTYRAGETLGFTVAFDEAVTVSGGGSTLGLTVGGTARSATLFSSSGNTLTYLYTVQAGDNDADGIAITGLSLNGTTIRDAAGNDAVLSLAGHLPSTAGILVDTQAPSVTVVTAPPGGLYGVGASLDFTVAFDEAVNVSGGGSTLGLTIGGTARNATLMSSGGNMLTYRYTVQAGDSDADGIAITGLSLNGTTIRDAAGNDAALSLAGHVPSLGGVLVDTTVPGPGDTQAPSVAGVIAPAADTYRAGETLGFTVAFDEAVNVSGGGSTLGLTVGGTARSATLFASSGNTLTYLYTVQAGDNDADGIAITGLSLNGTTIRDAAGNDAALSLAGHLPSTAGILVDTQAPSVTVVTAPPGGLYGVGASLDFTIAFNEALSVSGGGSTLGLTIGGTARNATLMSSGGNTLTYRYTVQAGDSDADGIAITGLSLNGSTIRDAVGNDAALSLAGHVPSLGGVLVDTTVPGPGDTQAPSVASVIAPVADTYRAGETLSFTVAFDEAVNVSGGGSTLGLTVGGTARSATLFSSSGNTLTYLYTVQAGDNDADGIAITGLSLNGTTIRDAAGNDAVLSLAGHLPSTAGILVDTQAPSVAIVTAPPGGLYGVGASLDFTVAFDEALSVSGGGSTLGLTIGGTARNATLMSSGGNMLTYRYTVQPGDSDADGIAITGLSLNGSTLRDAAGNDAALSLAGHVPSLGGVLVDTTVPGPGDTQAPSVASVIAPAADTYRAGETLGFTVAFDEAVNVSGGGSTLGLTVGGTARSATLVSSSGNTLTYLYTVQAGDNDADGIAITGLSLNGTTIRDAAGNDAVLSLAGHLPSTAGILVDTQAPSVTVVTAPPGGNYGVGAHLDFTIAFDEALSVSGGGSTLGLTIGGTARNATLMSSGGNMLTYRYTVQAGDSDADGIAITGLSLNGTTLRDTAGNDAALSLAGHVPSLGGVLVDTTVPGPGDTQAPSVAAVGAPANGTYAVGGQMEFTVTFDEAVIVSGGGSTLGLTVGGTARSATLVSSSGNTLTYRYTVQAGDSDADGIAITGLSLNGSTIRDAAGNDATLAIAGRVPPLGGVLVDGSVPDTSAPVFTGATVNGRTLVLSYDEAGQLDAAHGPAAGAFTVMAAGRAVAVSAVVVDAAAGTVTLTLASAVQHDQPVTVGYEDPTGGNDAAAIQDTAGNDAALLAATPVLNTTPPVLNPPPVDPPPSGGDTIDGVVVRVVTVTNGDGSVSQVVTIPVVMPTRVEQVGDRDMADIPLVKDAAGTSLLTAQLPLGFGLEASGAARPASAAASVADLVSEIRAHTVDGSADQARLTGAGSNYVGTLEDATPLLVQTLVPTAAANAAPGTLVISGAAAAAGHVPTALVIDACGLPAGSSVALHDVEFAVVMGAAWIVSDAGAQVVWGDSAAQAIMLGAGDDVVHGGAGNDIVGGAAGKDIVSGDEGDDLVFGGQDNDTIDGGSGNDIVQLAGNGRADYIVRVVDGELVMTHSGGGSDGTDIVGNVETLRFTGADMSVAGTAARVVEALTGAQASVATVDTMERMVEQGASLSQVAQALYGQAGANAALDDAAFVSRLYRNALDREADSDGMAFWLGHLARGVTRADVALGFASSAEKLEMPAEVEFRATDVAAIVRLYSVLFDRAPEEAGLNYWIGAHEAGMSIMAIADAFVASRESAALHGASSDLAFTEALYLGGMHRDAAPDEVRFWTELMANGQVDRGDMLLAFADSPEKVALMGVMSTSFEVL